MLFETFIGSICTCCALWDIQYYQNTYYDMPDIMDFFTDGGLITSWIKVFLEVDPFHPDAKLWVRLLTREKYTYIVISISKLKTIFITIVTKKSMLTCGGWRQKLTSASTFFFW